MSLAAITGIGGFAATAAASAASAPITVESGQAGTFVKNFNPFSPNAERPTLGLIYEPLFYFNEAKETTPQPWLATKYAWSDGGKTITFTVRSNATWTDGTKFTSADVAYTFNLLKSNPALNTNALPIASAAAPTPTTAVVHFTKSAYSEINYIAGSTYILPEHIWKGISNPSTFENTSPVGTGAYEVSSVSGTVMTLTANPHYYMAGLPKVKEYQFLYFSSNTSADLAIEDGQVDWANSYMPNITNVYAKKNPKYKVVDTPVAITELLPNMKNGPTADLAVRQAISDAIDRKQVSKVVYNGYANPISEDGLILPNFSEVANPAYGKNFAYSTAAAKKVLKADGYKMGSSGFFTKNGKELTITVQVPSGYTDYVQSLQIIQSELKSAGINLVVDGESVDAWTANTDNGNFQMVMIYAGFTSNPYVYYKNLIGSAGVPAEGKVDTVGDQGRYKNPTVDKLLADIAATPLLAKQKPDFSKIEQIFVKDLPVIPLFQQQNEGEFNGNAVSNIPSASNLYSTSGQQQPDLGWTAMHLVPVSK